MRFVFLVDLKSSKIRKLLLQKTKICLLFDSLSLFLQIRNETVGGFDFAELENDITVKGEVYRTLLPLLNSDNERERKKGHLALNFALAALDKREFGF